MTKEELQKLIDVLSEAGWDPMICDTDIPIGENPVFAGEPRETGNEPIEYIKAIVSQINSCPFDSKAFNEAFEEFARYHWYHGRVHRIIF